MGFGMSIVTQYKISVWLLVYKYEYGFSHDLRIRNAIQN